MSTINNSSLLSSSEKGNKILFLIRHAKSSWDDLALTDFERPLNERGKNDAPKMAKRLVDNKIIIDAFISSPAKRAEKTAELFAGQFGRKEKEIILVPALYDAPVETFYQIISEVDDVLKNIAVFAHNPGITSFANRLTEAVQIDNMPTCSVFALTVDTKSWRDFKDAEKKFWFFDYPKNN